VKVVPDGQLMFGIVEFKIIVAEAIRLDTAFVQLHVVPAGILAVVNEFNVVPTPPAVKTDLIPT
jgi:hypothetical protein